MNTFSMGMHFLGGLGLFLVGIQNTSNGLQNLAANQLKKILETLTKNRWSAVLFGIIVTVAMQSSAATTVMVVELVNIGIMTLGQALGVSLGSTVGTSIVIQLISFPMIDLALLFIFVGFVLLSLFPKQRWKDIGQTMIGFGSIFVGMNFLTGAFAPLRDAPEVSEFLSRFGVNPLLGILVSILITGLIQSSAAFLVILISLSTQGLLTLEAIIPLVMGAHIGGTFTTLVSSITAQSIDAKRVAIANTIYRVGATVVLFPFFPLLSQWIRWSAQDLPRQVANTHLFTAIFMVALFLPLNPILARWLMNVLPERKDRQEKRLKYLSKSSLELPTLALSQVRQEIRWIAFKILENMLEVLPRIFNNDPKWLGEIEKAWVEVEWHSTQLSTFLKELFWRNLTREQIVENHGYELLVKEFGAVADSILVMARKGQKMWEGKIEMTEEESAVLGDLFMAIAMNYLTLLRYLELKDEKLAQQITRQHQEIIEIYNVFQGNLSCKLPGGGSTQEEGDEAQKAIQELANLLYKMGEQLQNILRVIINTEVS